jgi:cytochrome b561
MYVTSRDSPTIHDAFMIAYLLLTVPWMVLSTLNSSRATKAGRFVTRRNRADIRKLALYSFLLTIPPLVWQYYRHSVMRIPGGE